MRIAVLGAAGQLGRDLCPRLPGEAIPLSRSEIDLTHPHAISATLKSLQLDALINCAAYNFVDDAEKETEAAFAVNAWGVRALASACRDLQIPFVHFSSDYVFGLDSHSQPWTEEDPPGPVSIYGLSKLAGEYLVRSILPSALVIRTCGLYGVWGSGGKGGNFVETMLRVAAQGKPLKVVSDQYCTPTYTVDVATATVSLLKANARGLYHITNSQSCSWYEFACEIFRQSGLSPELSAVTSSEFARPARRPGYSVLSLEKLVSAGAPRPRAWPEALAAYLVERRGRKP